MPYWSPKDGIELFVPDHTWDEEVFKCLVNECESAVLLDHHIGEGHLRALLEELFEDDRVVAACRDRYREGVEVIEKARYYASLDKPYSH